MPTARIITDELIRSAAPNPAAVSNAKKICSLGEFSNLRKTADETLIFGECRGSGKNPYNTSADFSGETQVFRCSCPSRQFPCKHSLALMMERLSGKNFETSDIPEDIVQKREKAAKRAERSTAQQVSPKQNKSAAEKMLRKQLEGLDLAESFVKDILDRGVYSVSSAAADQNACKLIIERAGTSISEAVKAAKNELKNTLSEPYAGVLLRFDEIELADDRCAVLKLGNESITLRAYYRRFPNTCDVPAVTDSRHLRGGAIFGLLHYIPQEHHILLCPMSLVHPYGITKLC